MKKLIGLFLVLVLSACSIEQGKVEDHVTDPKEELSGTFMLQAEPGYISADNDQDAEVYIINMESNEVYIDGKGKSFTKEDRERFESMSPEEKDELYEDREGPFFKIISLKATRDEIILEYEEETVTFTALSSSIFETESGVRYQIEENTSVSAYEESLSE